MKYRLFLWSATKLAVLLQELQAVRGCWTFLERRRKLPSCKKAAFKLTSEPGLRVVEKDYYEILQVHPRANPVVIKKAFRVLAAEYHPDKYPYSSRKWAEARFRDLYKAYEVLSEAALRSEYDALRASDGADEAASAGRDVEYERRVFFHLRRGLELYERAMRGGLLHSLSGRWESELDQSLAHFVLVISSLPDATLIEDTRLDRKSTRLNASH